MSGTVSTPWTCVCGHVNSGFASACYGGCGKDRDRTERDFVTIGKAPLSTPSSSLFPFTKPKAPGGASDTERSATWTA